MTNLYTKSSKCATAPTDPTNSPDQAFSARGITLAEFRPRDGRALDQGDFIDHPPRRLFRLFVAVLGFRGRQNRGHEIREALANTRARFHHQVALVANRPRHGLGHLQLLRPMLVVREPPSNASFGAKD